MVGREKKCSDEGDRNSKRAEIKHWYLWWCCSDQGGDPAVLSLVCQPFLPPTLQPWNQWDFLLNGSRAKPQRYRHKIMLGCKTTGKQSCFNQIHLCASGKK